MDRRRARWQAIGYYSFGVLWLAVLVAIVIVRIRTSSESASQLTTGLVVLAFVSTTATAVRFTVKSKGYFDSPGSTITFSTKVRKGNLYLRVSARSKEASPVAWLGVNILGQAYGTWDQQASNLGRATAGGVGRARMV